MNSEIFRWKLGIGDPTIEGWIISGLYFLAAIFCFMKFQNRHELSSRKLQTWLAVCFVLLFLSFNKQLDLQTLISDVGRYIAVKTELMEQRHIFKRAFILVVGLSAVSILFLFRENVLILIKTEKLAFAGILSLGLFVILRATSFHIFSDSLNEVLHNIFFFKTLEIISLITLILATLPLQLDRFNCKAQRNA
ncbi:MAG: hypothetical protein NE330_17235 [Lentisphaeraceae bacterium]|nr:hypothetical protein [Lentisphaeraceae bacterium]